MNKKIKFFLQPPITLSFIRKLKNNFHELTPGEMIIYFLFLRPFWDKKKRFFFEGELKLIGQMSIAERRALFQTILDNKPRHCFEIGTFTGGGSTFFLASAFQKLGIGHLVTMEISDHYYNKASKYYQEKLPELFPHVKFVQGSQPEDLLLIFPDDKKVDCVFFDGAEDGQQTLDQYKFFEPYFHKGSIIMFHDWNTEKTRAVRPVIENDQNWSLVMSLQPPISLGFVVFKKNN